MQFDLHQITGDDEQYSLTCAALSGEVEFDVGDVLLQPFLTHKYESLKGNLIERRSLTTPERVSKVISGEKIGSDIPSRFRVTITEEGRFRYESCSRKGCYMAGLYQTDAHIDTCPLGHTAR